MGFIKQTLSVFSGGMLLIGGVILACICLCCVGIIIIGAGIDQAQQEAIAANEGKGTLENPIPSGWGVIFEEMMLTPVRYRLNATDDAAMWRIKEEPAVGTEYAIVWIELTCRRAERTCGGDDFKVWLVDSNGVEWGEPFPLFVGTYTDLDLIEVANGNKGAGWQAFEFPTSGVSLQAIKFQLGAVTLYAAPPVPG
jgi:hypothetical protein